jgi:hypothetical protein
LNFVGYDDAKIEQIKNMTIYEFYFSLNSKRQQNLKSNEVSDRTGRRP